VLSELGAVSRDRVRCAPVPLGYSMPDVMLFDAPRKLLGGTWTERGRAAAVTLTLEESDFVRHGDEAVMTLVRERWAQQELPMSEWEIRRRLEHFIPTERIGTVIGQLLEAGALTVAGGRVPNRMFAPAGEKEEGEKGGKQDIT